MADKEDSAELIQVHPKDNVSDNRPSSSESLVQAIVADQSVFCALSQAILSAIKQDLPNHETAQSKNDKAAAPVGQSAEHSTGESVDQTVRAHKRQLPIDVIVVDENNPTKHPRIEDASDDGDLDGLLSPNSRWEPSEELDALLSVIQKPLQRFERRSILKEFPRPSSEAAFTPNLDNYLISMIPGVKIPDNSLRDIQDKALDVLGPLCTLYENFTRMYESLDEGAITIEKSAVMGMFNCVKKAVMLVGDTSAQMSAKRREQVLTKLNPVLSSLGKEDFPDAGKQLFGDGFESRLKLRSETANTVQQAKKAGTKQFFRGTAPRRFQGRFRGGRGQYRGSYQGFYRPASGMQSPTPSFRGRGRPHNFTPRGHSQSNYQQQ